MSWWYCIARLVTQQWRMWYNSKMPHSAGVRTLENDGTAPSGRASPRRSYRFAASVVPPGSRWPSWCYGQPSAGVQRQPSVCVRGTSVALGRAFRRSVWLFPGQELANSPHSSSFSGRLAGQHRASAFWHSGAVPASLPQGASGSNGAVGSARIGAIKLSASPWIRRSRRVPVWRARWAIATPNTRTIVPIAGRAGNCAPARWPTASF